MARSTSSSLGRMSSTSSRRSSGESLRACVLIFLAASVIWREKSITRSRNSGSVPELLGANALVADDLAPPRMLGAHKGVELVWRAAEGAGAEPGEPLAHFRQA